MTARTGSLHALTFLAVVAGCSREPAPSAPAIGYGTAMADIARRFELFERAAAAGRYELADYQLGEIEEQFTETRSAQSRRR